MRFLTCIVIRSCFGNLLQPLFYSVLEQSFITQSRKIAFRNRNEFVIEDMRETTGAAIGVKMKVIGMATIFQAASFVKSDHVDVSLEPLSAEKIIKSV